MEGQVDGGIGRMMDRWMGGDRCHRRRRNWHKGHIWRPCAGLKTEQQVPTVDTAPCRYGTHSGFDHLVVLYMMWMGKMFELGSYFREIFQAWILLKTTPRHL